MENAYEYLPSLNGKAPVADFSSFVPRAGEPYPNQWITDFLTVGPFVVKTDGAFETEYFYQREKVLSVDYLEADGGEAGVRPVLGGRVQNRSDYGPGVLTWREGLRKWGCLRFDEDEEAFHDAFSATVQGNCVFYAATYVRCQGEQLAILSYENSGCLLYVNGELADSQPYGRVKSLTTMGHRVAVRLRDGLNVILFKLRTGYLADTADLSMSFFAVHPVGLVSGNLGITYPQPTGAYLGRGEALRQMHYVFAGAFGGEAEGRLSYRAGGFGEDVEVPRLASGEVKILRVGAPLSGGEGLQDMEVRLRTEGDTAEGVFGVRARPWTDRGIREHIFSDFHFDTTYHLEQRTYAIGALHIAKEMLRQLRENPDFRIVLSEIDYLHPYFSLYPQDRELIREAFREGRAEADCFYNQPNELTSSPEALTRNLIYGQKYHMEYLGQPALVYTPGDVFGHPNQMSQLCAKGECLACRWGKVIVGLDRAFRHMSPDGTALTHNRGLGMDDAARLGLTHCGDSSSLGGWYPPYLADDPGWQRDSATRAAYSLFSIQSRGFEEDRQRHFAETGRELLQTHSRDLTQHHSGVLLTREDFKQANRLAENLLVTAEKLAVIAAFHGAEYPEAALDKAWRQLLCGQHHDSITGTNNEISFVDLMLEYREAAELAQGVIDGALEKLTAQTAAEGDRAVYVFNPHPWERTEPVCFPLPGGGDFRAVDGEGREYPVERAGRYPDGREKGCFLAPVPALGYRVFDLQEAEVPEARVDSGTVIENEFFRLTVDPERGGGIVSVWDKRLEREWMDLSEDGPGNRIAVLREAPDRMEPQHEFYTTGQKLFSSDSRAKVRRVRGEGFQRLEVVLRLDVIAVARQRITLWKGVARVDLETVIEDYQGRDDLFAVTFPVNVRGGVVTYDDRFAPHITGKSLRKLSFQTHQFLNYSFSRVAPVNQWMDLGPGPRVDMGEKGAFGIGMTAIVRREGAALDAGDRLLEGLTRRAVPVTLYSDQRVRETDGWRIVDFNEDVTNTDVRFVLAADGEPFAYAEKLLARLSGEEREAFAQQVRQRGTAVLYAVDRENELEKPVRVVLVWGRDGESLNAWAEKAARGLREECRVDAAGAFAADPCGEMGGCGAALLNNGNLACSVEGENLMTLMLFHTADFYGNMGRTTGGKQLIPEQKTFHASYAFCPHAGDYREGQLYRRAMEFNDPLIGREFAPQGGPLPREHGYLSCPEGFTLTAMKAGGYDLAGMRTPRRRLGDRGLVLRGFESNGDGGAISLSCGFRVRSAARVDLLEKNPVPAEVQGNCVRLEAGGFSIETLALEPELPEPCISGALVKEEEPVQPVYVRSWEQDRGSMPMGYLAVAGFLDRKVEQPVPGRWRLHVHLANNRADAGAAGAARLRVSRGLGCDTAEIPYRLGPGEAGVWPVEVFCDGEDHGILRLEYKDGGQRFEDILELGGSFVPEMSLEDRGDVLAATVVNRTDQVLSGELQLASPIETWGGEWNPHALLDLDWGPVAVEVGPGESREYVFPAAEVKGAMVRSFWAVGKLMVGNHIVFAHVCRKAPPHAHWTHVFEEEIHRDGGSLRKLYHLGDLPEFE